MSHLVQSRWARIVRALAVAVLCVGAAAALAAPMPNASRQVSITAREQPIGAFLQDLFATMDVPASVAPNLAGSVTGTFTGPAERVLRDISRVYNLIAYFDGSVMHVTPASDMQRRTFAVAPAASERLLREATDLSLTDTRNTLRRSGDGNMLAVGTRRFVEQVDELVRAGQAVPAAAAAAAGGGADFKVFYLRYAWAQDMTMTLGGRQVVLPGVASILRSVVGVRGGSGPLGQETLLRPTQPGLRGQGLASQGQPTRTSASSSKDAATELLVAALGRTAQPAEAAPTLIPDSNQVRIEAEPRLNAIIVRDLAERMPRYEQLIAALDVEPQSLEIEATIIDVNTDKMRELGINWRWNQGGNEALFGNGTASDALLKKGLDITPIGRGGIISAVLGSASQFIARINALQSEGAARVVSSPQVVTLSDVEAVFDNSSTFYVRVAGREQVDLFNVNAGTSLRVTPHVFRDRDSIRIKMMVQVEDGNLTGRQVDQIPVVERSTINTQALINEGESLLIGGMVRESQSSGVDKVPGLGDVPLVGNLFKTRTNSSARIERMFLITPRLAGNRPATTGAMLRANATPPAAPGAAPVAVQTAAPAPAPVAAPVAVAPRARPSVELDLDTPLPGSAAARSPAGAAPAAAPPASRAAPPPSGAPAARIALSNPTPER